MAWRNRFRAKRLVVLGAPARQVWPLPGGGSRQDEKNEKSSEAEATRVYSVGHPGGQNKNARLSSKGGKQ
jgi:hypothetical protein